jgi:hypothetical protein
MSLSRVCRLVCPGADGAGRVRMLTLQRLHEVREILGAVSDRHGAGVDLDLAVEVGEGR